MKSYIKKILVLLLFVSKTYSQETDSNTVRVITSLEEALKNPSSVTKLNLSNQNITFEPNIFSKFENLEYLSLKNDHLKYLPVEIGSLKKLKTLDLSGNDFELLPTEFKNLSNLQELFLDD